MVMPGRGCRECFIPLQMAGARNSQGKRAPRCQINRGPVPINSQPATPWRVLLSFKQIASFPIPYNMLCAPRRRAGRGERREAAAASPLGGLHPAQNCLLVSCSVSQPGHTWLSTKNPVWGHECQPQHCQAGYYGNGPTPLCLSFLFCGIRGVTTLQGHQEDGNYKGLNKSCFPLTPQLPFIPSPSRNVLSILQPPPPSHFSHLLQDYPTHQR